MGCRPSVGGGTKGLSEEYLEKCREQHPIYINIKGKRIKGIPQHIPQSADPYSIDSPNEVVAHEEGYAPPLQFDLRVNKNVKTNIDNLINDIQNNNKPNAINTLKSFDFTTLQELLNYLLSININKDGQSDLITLISSIMGSQTPGKKPEDWNNGWKTHSQADGVNKGENNFDKHMNWNKDWDNSNDIQSNRNNKGSAIGQRYIKGVGNIFAPKITIDK